MPNINDFKLIARKSERYADLLLNGSSDTVKKVNQKDKERIGFYLFILENVCGIQDISDLRDLITDSEFNHLVLNESKIDDYGIDAIYLDEDELAINLFNFKYREKFKPGKQQNLNSPFISTKFINAIETEDTRELKGKLKSLATSIIEKLNSRDEWKLCLYVVSNEGAELRESDVDLKRLETHYGLEIISIGLTQICQYMSIRPAPISAKLTLDNDAIMSFSEDSISSSKSYITRLPLNEVIRITCSNEQLRNDCNLENLESLEEAELDYSVLFDNVRGCVTRSKYNENILRTLREDPSKFFMYNNGLTLIAGDIDAKPINAKKKIRLELTSIQVINGGQTLRTIHNFHKKDAENIVNYLANSQILVRIFKTTNDTILNNKIAEYTNSQNSISSVDLKSLRQEQIQLEQFLDQHDIVYSRKTGNTGLTDRRDYKYKISMERFGQILFSLNGNPHRATNRKKQIFDKYYDMLFSDKNLDIEKSPKHINKYYEIKTAYDKKAKKGVYKSTDQKIFYILYLQADTSKRIGSLIDSFEKAIEEYVRQQEETRSLTVILSQPSFKEFIDKKFLKTPVS